MPGITLRAGHGADAPALTEIFLAARRDMHYLPVLHADAETATFMAGVIGRARVEVAERPGELLGFAALRHSWLDHLYVHPRAQGHGVGTRLLEWVKRARPTGIDLWVFQENARARSFYETHGFRLVALTDGAGNEESRPDAHLHWQPAATAP
jgi:GNAT superfamily N-acetyltransferase